LCGASAASDQNGPPGAAFYSPPSPLPAGIHGEVIWARPLTGAAVLADAAENRLVLYHETTVDGKDVAVSGAVAVPKGTPPRDGWPVISWAHGTTGNAPLCAPTRAEDGPNVEQTYLDAWVARGYAVVQTDYEGQGTPGLHPYFVGAAAAHDVTDMVRAARALYPQIGKRWFVLGHSEGGSASIFTAAIGPGWAPELTLEGAVSFAPGSHIASMLNAMPTLTRPTRAIVFMLEMIEGIASVDPAIDLRALLTPEALAKLPSIQERCTDDLMNDDGWVSLPPAQVFAPHADLRPLARDFALNEANRTLPRVPLLLLQGAADTIVSSAATNAVDAELCAHGANVTYDQLAGMTHDTIVAGSLPQTEAWVDDVAAGDPPKPNCS
jgi:alpha-beta hydrolase superfamily lysophospholipase